MEILSDRQLGIMYCLISNMGFVTSEQLADFTGSSIRTVKKEISLLRERYYDHCCTIEVNMSKGYFLNVNDMESYNNFVCTIRSEYSFFKNTNIEIMSRRLYIVQRILSSDYVKIEEICEELFLTRSSLKNDLVWINSFFDSYKVKLSSTSGKGLKVFGSEYDIRMLMVETFCSQYHDLKDTPNVEKFNEMFFVDIAFYQQIRHQFLKIVRESLYATKDISTKKLATYLALAKQRIGNKEFVNFDLSKKSCIENKYEFILAKKIFEMPELFDNIDYTDDELYFFALTLLCFRDVDLTNSEDNKTIDILLVNEAENIYNKIFNEYKSIGKTLVTTELFSRYRLDFVSCIYSIFVLNEFDANDRQKLTTYYEIAEYEVSPFAVEITRIILLELKKLINAQFNDVSSIRLILMIEIILKKVNFTYYKRKLAVMSVAGKLIAREYKELLIEKFGHFISYAHVFNQYEMRRIDFTNYDIAISDSDGIFNNYPIDITNSNIFRIEDSTVKIFNDVFRPGYDFSQVKKLIRLTEFETEFQCSSFETFFKMISFRYGGSKFKSMENELLNKEKIYSHLNPTSQVAIIFCDYSTTGKEFVDVYLGTSKLFWSESQEVKGIIVISTNPDIHVSNFKVINNIMQVIYNQNNYLLELLDNPAKTYESIFNLIISNNFMM